MAVTDPVLTKKKLNISVDSSMVAYDHTSKDRNDSENVANLQEKNQKEIDLVEKYWRKNIDLICLRDGRVQTVFMGPQGPGADQQQPKNAVAARRWARHMLYGDWRLATDEDVKRQAEEDRKAYELSTKLEAKRMAQAAGLMFKEVSDAAGAITRLNQSSMTPAELKAATTEPTEAELLEAQKKIEEALRLKKAEKDKKDKK